MGSLKKVLLLCFFSLPLIGAGQSRESWDKVINAIERGDISYVRSQVTDRGPFQPWNKTRGGRSLLQIAIHSNQPTIIQYLKNIRQRDSSSHEWDILKNAFRSKNLHDVTAVVPSIIKETDTTRGGKSLIEWALELGASQEIISYLRELGARVSSAGPGGGSRPSGIGYRCSADEICFYDRGDPYYAFTNFYDGSAGSDSLLPSGISNFGIDIDGKRWPTTEHYFQAMKFVGRNEHIQDEIRRTHGAGDVFRLANSRTGTYKNLIRPDWRDVSDSIMRKALQAKFMQHPQLRDLLANTLAKKIVEASDKDEYWGDPSKSKTGGKQGQNMLGTMLMELRDQLRKEKPSAGPGPGPSAGPGSSREGEYKETRAAQGAWGVAHNAILRDLQNFKAAVLLGEISNANKALESAKASLKNIKKADLNAQDPELGQTLSEIAFSISGDKDIQLQGKLLDDYSTFAIQLTPQ